MPDPIYLKDAAGPYFNDWRGNQVREGDKVIYPASGGDWIQEATILQITASKYGVYSSVPGAGNQLVPGAFKAKIKVQIIRHSYDVLGASQSHVSKPSYPNANKVTKLVVSSS